MKNDLSNFLKSVEYNDKNYNNPIHIFYKGIKLDENNKNKGYFENLNEYMRTVYGIYMNFSFTGEIDFTYNTLSDIFKLSIKKFIELRKKHEENRNLFGYKENKYIKKLMGEIDKKVDEYLEESRNENIKSQQDSANYLDVISLAIERFFYLYMNVIQNKMNEFIEDTFEPFIDKNEKKENI